MAHRCEKLCCKEESMKKAAIFDMDGLMFDTERIWKDSWNAIVPKYGYEPDPTFPKEVCGTSGEHTLEVIRKHYPGIDAVAYRADVRAAETDDNSSDTNSEKETAQVPDDLFYSLYGKKKDLFFNKRWNYDGTPLRDRTPEKQDPKDCYVLEDGMNGLKAGIAAGCATIMVIDLTEPNDFVRENCVGIYNSLLEVRDAIAAGEV